LVFTVTAPGIEVPKISPQFVGSPLGSGPGGFGPTFKVKQTALVVATTNIQYSKSLAPNMNKIISKKYISL